MARRARTPHPEREGLLKVGELEERAGVTRDSIHFYLKVGLLPRPTKSAATVAWYGPSHLHRLLCLRLLRARGLALGTVRRLLDAGLDALDLDAVSALGAALAPAGSWEDTALPPPELAPSQRALLARYEPALREALSALSSLDAPLRAAALSALDARAPEVERAARGLAHDSLELARALPSSPQEPAAEALALAHRALDAWRSAALRVALAERVSRARELRGAVLPALETLPVEPLCALPCVQDDGPLDAAVGAWLLAGGVSLSAAPEPVQRTLRARREAGRWTRLAGALDALHAGEPERARRALHALGAAHPGWTPARVAEGLRALLCATQPAVLHCEALARAAEVLREEARARGPLGPAELVASAWALRAVGPNSEARGGSLEQWAALARGWLAQSEGAPGEEPPEARSLRSHWRGSVAVEGALALESRGAYGAARGLWSVALGLGAPWVGRVQRALAAEGSTE